MVIHPTQQYGVIGLGRSGLSTVEYLCQHGVTPLVFDTRDTPPLAAKLPDGVALLTGELTSHEDVLSGLDVLIVGPGLSIRTDLFKRLKHQGKSVIGDVELFAGAVDAPVIAITGSNGKTTVTTLVGEMAREAGIEVAVGGNIGTPVLALLGQHAKLYVLELSSFQLETTDNLRLRAATVLNVSADHMNRYHDLSDYRDAKLRIYQHCQCCIANADDPQSWPNAEVDSLQLFSIEKKADYWINESESALMIGDECLLHCQSLKMSGRHNWANALAALALGDAAGIAREAMIRTLKRFSGLAHRCETVGYHQGVRFINDSKATNIGATIAALQGFAYESGQTWLIAGGDGKGADFNELSPWLAPLAGLVVFGQDAARLQQVCPRAKRVDDLPQALSWCVAKAQKGDRVLLSPACASLDMYSGFEARGEHFRQLVEAL
ncbi:UDP-N-acetylmuramoyl-L-alanine--D-glutamate ligase [Celerinatantimonas yamalensis]|uniref:UDP-N-acetylmuramoylalanine--D-glutamate ligase n=1 Tax=Celerinatantimonas yamalensis TaxID=559956 RepID=A0ABW9G5A2_9GAMM